MSKKKSKTIAPRKSVATDPPPAEPPPTQVAPAAGPAAGPAAEGEVRFEIRTPQADFHGERFGVSFSGGVGYTDDAEAAKALDGIGYTVITRH